MTTLSLVPRPEDPSLLLPPHLSLDDSLQATSARLSSAPPDVARSFLLGSSPNLLLFSARLTSLALACPCGSALDHDLVFGEYALSSFIHARLCIFLTAMTAFSQPDLPTDAVSLRPLTDTLSFTSCSTHFLASLPSLPALELYDTLRADGTGIERSLDIVSSLPSLTT